MNFVTNKPRLSFWQIWNMSFGFMGIQYGFGLQQANMSYIYRELNADESSIPFLWLAGPLTGLIIQPIIGAMSDRTWGKLGRRKPYYLVGALVTSFALIMMPNSSALWMAASLMWILDAGLNITFEPFRAFVGDRLPEEQRTLGFSTQSFFVGIGQTLANIMPFVLTWYGIKTATESGVTDSVKFSFYLGAAVLIGSVLWTAYTTKEYPPEDLEAFKKWRSAKAGIINTFKEIGSALTNMPRVMKQLWWVKFFTWYGLPLMWQYLSLSVAKYAFNAPDKDAPGFEAGIEWGGLCFAVFNIGCFGVAFFIPMIAEKVGRRMTHSIFLTIGALGFFSMMLSNDKYMFMVGMLLVGLSWASILSMPYVLLSASVPPERMGVYMGIFNGFICIPQVISMFTIPFLYENLLGNEPINALLMAGCCLILAAGACFIVEDNFKKTTQ